MLKLVAALLLSALSLAAQQNNFNGPFPPHKVIGNVYYVGSDQLATYLITTPQGHIIINSDFESTIPLIRQNVEKLGFKMSDIKIILGSHAHGDHMEGDALLKEYTGAQVMAMDRDVPALKAMKPGGKEHPIDRTLHDGDKVTLGGMTLTANLTPGHTKGCTTWTFDVTDAGKTYKTIVVCSVGVNPDYILVNNKDYPNIQQDYRASFAKLRAMKIDVFLGAHGAFYDLKAKYDKLQKGGPNPFIDPAGFMKYINDKERDFNAMLQRQQAAK
jgi:metallo-beta-lactamase class B